MAAMGSAWLVLAALLVLTAMNVAVMSAAALWNAGPPAMRVNHGIVRSRNAAMAARLSTVSAMTARAGIAAARAARASAPASTAP